MKKSRILLASAVCAMTLFTTACGETAGESKGNTTVSTPTNNSGNTSRTTSSSTSTAVSSANTDANSAADSTPANSTVSSTPAVETTGLAHGTWSGTTYTSTFLGIKGEFGSDWTITTDKELAAAIGASEMSVDSMKTAMSSFGSVTEMMAQGSDQTVNIVIEDTSVTKTPKGDEYFTTMLSIGGQQFEAFGAAMGVEMKANISESTVKFCGDDTRCLYIVLTTEGVDVHEIQIPVFDGDYITSLTFGAKTKADAEALVSSFTKA